MIASNKRLLLENNPREYYKYYYYYYYSYERAPRESAETSLFFFHETLNPLSSNPPLLSVLFPSLLFERERRERQDFGLRRATSKTARSFEEGEPPPRVPSARVSFLRGGPLLWWYAGRGRGGYWIGFLSGV